MKVTENTSHRGKRGKENAENTNTFSRKERKGAKTQRIQFSESSLLTKNFELRTKSITPNPELKTQNPKLVKLVTFAP